MWASKRGAKGKGASLRRFLDERRRLRAAVVAKQWDAQLAAAAAAAAPPPPLLQPLSPDHHPSSSRVPPLTIRVPSNQVPLSGKPAGFAALCRPSPGKDLRRFLSTKPQSAQERNNNDRPLNSAKCQALWDLKTYKIPRIAMDDSKEIERERPTVPPEDIVKKKKEAEGEHRSTKRKKMKRETKREDDMEKNSGTNVTANRNSSSCSLGQCQSVVKSSDKGNALEENLKANQIQHIKSCDVKFDGTENLMFSVENRKLFIFSELNTSEKNNCRLNGTVQTDNLTSANVKQNCKRYEKEKNFEDFTESVIKTENVPSHFLVTEQQGRQTEVILEPSVTDSGSSVLKIPPINIREIAERLPALTQCPLKSPMTATQSRSRTIIIEPLDQSKSSRRRALPSSKDPTKIKWGKVGRPPKTWKAHAEATTPKQQLREQIRSMETDKYKQSLLHRLTEDEVNGNGVEHKETNNKNGQVTDDDKSWRGDGSVCNQNRICGNRCESFAKSSQEAEEIRVSLRKDGEALKKEHPSVRIIRRTKDIFDDCSGENDSSETDTDVSLSPGSSCTSSSSCRGRRRKFPDLHFPRLELSESSSSSLSSSPSVVLTAGAGGSHEDSLVGTWLDQLVQAALGHAGLPSHPDIIYDNLSLLEAPDTLPALS